MLSFYTHARSAWLFQTVPEVLSEAPLEQPWVFVTVPDFSRAELDLQSCTQLQCRDLEDVQELSNLKRLNLYCMNVSEKYFTTIGYVVWGWWWVGGNLNAIPMLG